MTTTKGVDILLVEDNPGDVLLTKKVFAESRVLNVVHVVGDGDSALDFLRRRGTFADAPRPGIVLLDINLPGMNGLEVLKAIKADDELKSIPVVMLTTSRTEEDIVKAYSEYASSYIAKPINMQEFFGAIRSIEKFYLSIVELPDGIRT